MKKFDSDFLLGAATAAHQVEGNNIHNDCWAMEHMKYTSYKEPSLDAVDQYNRYEEDIRLMAQAGLNAYRFSIEWARIEPEEGVYDEAEVDHYRKVIRCCKENGLEPIVTLMHFSSPVWLIRKGGWEADSTVEDFARYAKYIITKLGSELKYVCTINEANMGLQIAEISKRYMQKMMADMAAKKASAEKNAASGESKADDSDGKVQVGINLEQLMKNRELAAAENMEVFGTREPQVFTSARTTHGDEIIMLAHQAAKKEIKALFPGLQVGLTLSLHDIQAVDGGEANAWKTWSDEFTHYIPYIFDDDFLGVQNYTRSIYDENGLMPDPEGTELTQMDYEYYPEALGHVLRRVANEFKGKLFVTENGIATADDSRRCDFINTALEGVQDCMENGLPVIGYLHWSLLDNFEWQKGFSMTFGLIAVDRTTQKRTPKESLKLLGSYR